jgi:hypothetical protein
MMIRVLKIASASLFGLGLLANAGCCSSSKGSCVQTASAAPCKAPCGTKITDPCVKPSGELTAELPPNAKAGECYAKVFVPPTFRTVTERVLVKAASEQIEIVPARYEWVDEKILVKDSSTELVAVPAEFDTKEQTIQTASGHTDWEVNKGVNCDLPKNQPAKDVFCLVQHPAEQTTIRTEYQVKPATVRSNTIPAEYQTVRRQKLASAATTRKICIPAEYESVEKTVKVCDGRMAWQRVICEKPASDASASLPNHSKVTLSGSSTLTARAGR